MSIFGNLKDDAVIEEASDRLGGGGPLDSNVYMAKVELAYIDYAKSKAMSLNVHFDVNGAKVRQTFWMTSGEAKGCKPYYTKDGKNYSLPGYIAANDLCLLTIDQSIADTDPEEKAISLYDFEQRKEVPQKKMVLTELIGKEVQIGVLKQVVDKNIKNDAYDPSAPQTDTNQAYIPSGETRELNEVDKMFHAEYGVTVTEAKAGLTEPDFLEKWKAKNEGKVVDKTKAKSGGATAGAPTAGAPAAAPKKSLFS